VSHEWDACLAAIEQQLQRSPSCEYPLYVKALIFRQRGRIHESLALFQTATCLNPRSTNNLTQVGHSLALLGKHKQALTVYAEAAKTVQEQAAAAKGGGKGGSGSSSGSWPEDWALLHHSGASHLALGRHDEAVSWLTRALKVLPHEATYVLLGKAHEQRGAFAQAQLIYQAAVRDDANTLECILRKERGITHLKHVTLCIIFFGVCVGGRFATIPIAASSTPA
jgi:Bardet-Biedl syndrome 4 protein